MISFAETARRTHLVHGRTRRGTHEDGTHELFTNDKTETVVLLNTEFDELTAAEHVRAPELAMWLIDEGWTIMASAESPLAPVVRKGAEAMHSTHVSYQGAAAGGIETAGVQLGPHHNHHFGR